ncbi:NAD-dependent epimerase/dehydratase family protein [Echinicola sp. CAU 1574]|uniref:NAD-dependent epimerase/dehydratase family protein n=1 Tax=Echinicola arenosa TaxID=2774144 RepID=A0ABR9ARZ5_9BACT|nr:NAD-dependent epimerase/dehydratase family protein [Echinicola arenosa]MBD8490399.1 NAD-dependent epimerase/dehydratase family protein [Echinicola arenosa]
MKTIALVSGASGLIGVQLLHQLFKEKAYDYVVSVSRRELAFKHHKLIQVVVDFQKIDQISLLDKLREFDFGGDNHELIRSIETKDVQMHAFCALGTTIKKAKSQENFYKIDHDFVINFARWAHQWGASKFLYVSSLGADQQSSIFYNKVKGEVEEDLKVIPFKYLGIFRPSILLGDRKETRIGESVGKAVMKAFTSFGLFKKYKPIYDHQVAKAMIHQALNDELEVVKIIESKQMQVFE